MNITQHEISQSEPQIMNTEIKLMKTDSNIIFKWKRKGKREVDREM